MPTATARSGFTRDHRHEATLLLLLLVVLQSGAAVAVVWAQARTQELTYGWGVYIHTT